MKKSTVKSTTPTAKTPAPATKATKSVKPATVTKSAASATKPKAVKAKAAVVVAPKPKTKSTPNKVAPEVAKPIASIATPIPAAPATVSTTIVAAIDVGFGNFLTLRGEGAGLSWDVGRPLTCVNQDRWCITLPDASGPIVCKFLLNDETWNTGENYTLLPGSSVVLDPVF